MKQPYTYCTVRYVHDPSAGESINVGVVLYSREAKVLRAKFEAKYGVLTKLFAHFDGEHFRRVLLTLESDLDNFRAELEQANQSLFELELPEDAIALMRRFLPDTGLSFQLGDLAAGLSRDLTETAENIFHHMVIGQRPFDDRDSRREDDEVWGSFQKPFRERGIMKALRPEKIQTEDLDLQFDHVFNNGHKHIIQPLSLDYQNADSITKTAARWGGYGVALANEVSQIIFLLGKPRRESHLPAYNKAKRYLQRLPVEARIVEESEAEEYADELAGFLVEHGVLEKTTTSL